MFYLSIFVATGVASPLLISLLQSSGACESTTLLFVLPNYVGMALSLLFQPKNEGLMGYVEVAGGYSMKVGGESTPKASTPSSSPPPSPSRAAVAQEKKTKAIPHLLIVFLCIIDAISAGLNLTGLVFCGSGVYTVVYSSVTMWTAIFSWIILGRKLQALQWLGIWIIVVGLSLTSVFAPSTIGPVVNVGSGPDDGESVVVDDGGSSGGGGSGGGGGESVLTFSLTFSPPSSASQSNLVSDSSSRMSLGIVLVVCGSLLHSLSYIISEIILTTFQASGITPFRLSSIMGMFGLAVFGFWQVIYTLPRFQVLVVDEVHRHGGVLWVIVLSYALLVACSLIHAISFFSLIKRLGSTTTGVLKGLQSVLTFVLSHYFFCAIQASQCFSNTKGISLGLVLLGVFFYSYFEVPEDVRGADVESGHISGSGSLQTLAIEMGLRPKPNFSFYQLAYDEAKPGELAE